MNIVGHERMRIQQSLCVCPCCTAHTAPPWIFCSNFLRSNYVSWLIYVDHQSDFCSVSCIVIGFCVQKKLLAKQLSLFWALYHSVGKANVHVVALVISCISFRAIILYQQLEWLQRNRFKGFLNYIGNCK